MQTKLRVLLLDSPNVYFHVFYYFITVWNGRFGGTWSGLGSAHKSQEWRLQGNGRERILKPSLIYRVDSLVGDMTFTTYSNYRG